RHSDLLAYLVRRLLENGANGSFVNMIADRDVPAEQVARDPFEEAKPAAVSANPRIKAPADLFMPARRNSRGLDTTDPLALAALDAARAEFATRRWSAAPMLAVPGDEAERFPIVSPATGKPVGEAVGTGAQTIGAAIAAAEDAAPAWGARPVAE